MKAGITGGIYTRFGKKVKAINVMDLSRSKHAVKILLSGLGISEQRWDNA